MKSEHFVLAAVSLLLMSCSSDVINEPPVQLGEERVHVTNLFSSNRSLDEIHSFAMDATGYLTTGNTSRSDMKREIDKERGIKCITKGVSRAEASTDTLIYIVNYKDNAGFAVISARRSADPILAVVGKGSYDSVVKSGNTGFNLFMNMATDYVSQCPEESPYSTLGIDDPLEIQELKRVEYVLADDTISPRVKVQWGQGGFYGSEFDNKIAGCANVASAMIMSYFEHPKSIELKHKTPATILELDWNNMKRHKSGPYVTCCQPNPPHDTIALLMREIGKRSKSNDSNPDGTSTYTSNMRNTLKGLGYNVGVMTDFTSGCIVKNLRDENSIIAIRGDRLSDETSDSNDQYIGHMWIADGYIYKKIQVIEYVRPVSSQEWTEIQNATNETYMNHFNWGSDGYGDDYYNDRVFCNKYNKRDYKYNVQFFTVKL